MVRRRLQQTIEDAAGLRDLPFVARDSQAERQVAPGHEVEGRDLHRATKGAHRPLVERAVVEDEPRVLDRLLETTPDHPSVPYWCYFKGAVLTRQGQLEQSAECARRTVELQPYFFLAAVMLANALGSLGRLEEARAAWQRVQAIHPAFTAAGYAHDIQLQALTDERAEPHLAGLRTAGLLA